MKKNEKNNENEIYRLNNIELRQETEFLKKYLKDIENKKEDLQNLVKYRERFITDIVHDLRNPIADIQGYTELILNDIITDVEKRKMYLKRILDKTQVLKKLTNELFEVTKLESGQLSFNFSTIAMSELIEWIESKYTFDICSFNKKFSIKAEENIANSIIFVDMERIERVFSNIIYNAIDHSDCNSLEVLLKEENQMLRVDIKDDGIGIPEEDVRFIFDRYYKGSQFRSLNDRGNGLGLAIAKEIVEYHLGEIWVESIVGQGSTFIFTLPIKKIN